jgi:hypothetical protein
MWGDLHSYLLALGSYWKWAVTGGPFLLDNIVKRVRPDWAKKLDELLPPPRRQKYEIRLMVLVAFLAGFLAWRDEHHARLDVENKLNNRYQTTSSQRDPDGLYQFERMVGRVELPKVDEGNGTVTFERIVDAANLNISDDFQYRDYILHIKGTASETTGEMSGHKTRALWKVSCVIKGRT